MLTEPYIVNGITSEKKVSEIKDVVNSETVEAEGATGKSRVSTVSKKPEPLEDAQLIYDISNSPPPTVTVTCSGSMFDSGNGFIDPNSNIGALFNQPITTSILLIILYIAYYMWANRTEVSAVSYCYSWFVEGKEYWRALTASLAHFELMHLGFNSMALYSFGMLEGTYGSLKYAYLSVDLVIITMLICTFIYHLMITKFDRPDVANQQAVGYSCVLFAWMVAASVRMREFCPIFLLPSLCFSTW
jgi:membrane associated rhomboid family serine protease